MAAKTLPIPLINLLSDGAFHSGESIGEVMGISRAAVWKKLQSLDGIGLNVESVKGRGYRLAEPISLFDVDRLSGFAKESSVDIHVYENIDSTNAQMLRMLLEGNIKSGDVVVAELQESGRGRRGKPWLSPFASNMYCSVLQSFDDGAASLDGLSLVVGLSLVQALERCQFDGVKLKWPNDVLCQGKKLAGILLELNGDPTGLCNVVIGIGVNINMQDSEGRIDQPWTSLAKIMGETVDKNVVLMKMLGCLAVNIELFKSQGFQVFAELWKEYDAFAGEEVFVTLGEKRVHGNYSGVNERGELLVDVGGVVQVFNGGEVSLRK